MEKIGRYPTGKYLLNPDKLISFFLGLFLFGSLIKGFASIKYIGLYGSIALFIYIFIRQKHKILLSYRYHVSKNKILIYLLIIFMLSILISIFFSYSDIKPSMKEFRIEFLNVTIFMIISIGTSDKYTKRIFFYAIVMAFVYNIILYGYHYVQTNPNFDFSIRLERNFSDRFEMLYPFIISSIFIFKNKRAKTILSSFLLIGLFGLIMTGARGGWVTIIVETLLFVIIFLLIEKRFIKKILMYAIYVLFASAIMITYVYKNSSSIQSQINLGINPDGRETIIQTRLPIFLEHGNYMTGIGGPGNYQYNKFLNDYKSPKVFGKYEGKEFHYNSDEPLLLQIFYKEGLIGLGTFLILSLYVLWSGLKRISINSDVKSKFLISAVIISYIGEFFVRGIVEGRSFKYIIIYLTIFIIFSSQKEANEDSQYIP